MRSCLSDPSLGYPLLCILFCLLAAGVLLLSVYLFLPCTLSASLLCPGEAAHQTLRTVMRIEMGEL